MEILIRKHSTSLLQPKKNYKTSKTKKGKRRFLDLRPDGWNKGKSSPNTFFNLEKRNYEKNTISQIKVNNGETTTNLQLIQREVESHFSKLYTTKINDSLVPPNKLKIFRILLKV